MQTQLHWIGIAAIGFVALIVFGARIWRLWNRDLEADARKASRGMAIIGAILVALALSSDIDQILIGGIAGLFFLTAWFLKFLSESAHQDKYRAEEF